VISQTSRLAMHLSALTLILGGLAGCSAAPTTSTSDTGTAAGTGTGTTTSSQISFARDIEPILQINCASGGSLCHGDPSVVTMGAQSDIANRDYLGPPPDGGAFVPFTPAITMQVYTAMVGKPSLEDPSMNVVTAGDPTKSFLMYKMDGNLTALGTQCMTGELANCGALMPFASPTALPQATRDKVRSWITQGAKNN